MTTPTHTNETLRRYYIVSEYINNQTDEAWRRMIRAAAPEMYGACKALVSIERPHGIEPCGYCGSLCCADGCPARMAAAALAKVEGR